MLTESIVRIGVVLLLLFCINFDVAYSPSSAAALAKTTVEKTLQKPASLTASQILGYKRAQIALNEYEKNVHEATKGCNCGPDVDKYTDGHRAQWCTMFASWVTNQAGAPVYSDKTKSWRITNSRDLANYLKQHGTWHSRDEMIAKNLQPQVGDCVIFWRGSYEDQLGHVDIVIANGDKLGTGDLIGGNLLDQVYYHRNIDYLGGNYYPFLGFGHAEK